MTPDLCYPEGRRSSNRRRVSEFHNCQVCSPQEFQVGSCKPCIAHIIFDWGSTISLKSYTKDIFERKIKKELGIPEDEILFEREMKDLLQEGKMEESQFVRSSFYSKGKLPSSEEIERYLDMWKRICHEHVKPIPEMVNLIKNLTQKYKVSLLSDVHKLKGEVIRQRGFYDEFHKVFLSYEIGYQKPQRQIYEYVLNHIAEPPDKVLFIDNNLENLRAAKQCGIHVIHLDNTVYNPSVINGFLITLSDYLDRDPPQTQQVFSTSKEENITLEKIVVQGGNPILKAVLGDQKTNTYVFGKNGNVLLIDPAFEMQRIESYLNEHKYSLIQILLTHGHLDHWAGLHQSFQGIPLSYNRLDCKQGTPLKGISASQITVCPRVPETDLREGMNINIEGLRLDAIETPGHSPGSISFVCHSQKIIFSGDIITEKGTGKIGHPGSDKSTREQSILKILSYPDDYTLYPSHGAAFSIAEFKEKFPEIKDSFISHAFPAIKYNLDKKTLTESKKRLELLGTFEDLQYIGNFKKVLEDKPFGLKEFLSAMEHQFFRYDKEGMKEWIGKMEELHEVFSALHKLYTDFSLYRKNLVHLTISILLALQKLYSLPSLNIEMEDWFKIIIFDHWNILPRNQKTIKILDYIDSNEEQFKKDLRKIAPIFTVKKSLINYSDFYNSPSLEIYEGKTVDFYTNNTIFYQLAGFYSWETYIDTKMLGVYPKVYAYHFLNKEKKRSLILKHYTLSLSHELLHYKTSSPFKKTYADFEKPLQEIFNELRRFCLFANNYSYFSVLENLYTKKNYVIFSPFKLFPPPYFTGVYYLIALFDIDTNPNNINYIIAFTESNNNLERIRALHYSLINVFNKKEPIIKTDKHLNYDRLFQTLENLIQSSYLEITKKIVLETINKTAILSKKRYKTKYKTFDLLGQIFVWFIMDNFVVKNQKDIFIENLKALMEKYKNADCYYKFKNVFFAKNPSEIHLIEAAGPMNERENNRYKRNRGIKSIMDIAKRHPELVDRSHYMGRLLGTDLCVGVSREEFAPLFKKENQWYREHGFTEEMIKIRAKKVIKSFNYGPDMYYEIFGEEPTDWDK